MAPISHIKVIIVGAGVGGLTLGILLERANIAYEILEKHPTFNPMGSAICLVPSVQPLFQQLGLLDEIKRLSKPFGEMVFREENMSIMGKYSGRTPLDIKERYGEYCQIISRKDLCTLLAEQVPKSKIKYGKRVLEIRQNVGEVIIQCSDKSTHHADILVGADGPYSAARQHLHNELNQKGLLSKHDSMPMRYQYDCIVGVTDPLDPNDFPALCGDFSEFQTVLSKDSSYSHWYIPLTGNKFSWMVVKYHDKGKKYAEDQIFKQSDWREDVAGLMAYDYRNLKTAYGCNLEYFMERTPRGSMAKVMLEEKYYKAWYGGRIVLAGDACHKVVPVGGQGANQAIHDVITLANQLVTLESNSVPDIEKVFAAYYKDRSPIGKAVVQVSGRIGNIANRKGWLNDLVRKAALRHTPRWLAQLMNDRMSYDRPQAEYLPFVKVGGTLQPKPQKPSAFIPFVNEP